MLTRKGRGNGSAGDKNDPNRRKRKADTPIDDEQVAAAESKEFAEVLSMVQANFEEFADKCNEIICKLNYLERDCINETQPIDQADKDRHLSHIREMRASLNLLLSHLSTCND